MRRLYGTTSKILNLGLRIFSRMDVFVLDCNPVEPIWEEESLLRIFLEANAIVFISDT